MVIYALDANMGIGLMGIGHTDVCHYLIIAAIWVCTLAAEDVVYLMAILCSLEFRRHAPFANMPVRARERAWARSRRR